MTSARFIAPARREFLLEIAYYTAIQPELGARFASRVEEAVARAIAFPLAHHSRHPEYWQPRVQEP